MEDKTLANVIEIIPKQYFRSSLPLSILALLRLTIFGGGSYWLLVVAWVHNYYLLYPVGWFLAGTFLNASFVIAHDCAHYSFFQSRWANNVVAQLLILPSLYPLNAWIVSHNGHHRYAGLDSVDEEYVYKENAWRHYSDSLYERLEKSSRFGAAMSKISRHHIVLLPSSFIHVLNYHYRLKWYKKGDRPKVLASQIISVAAIGGFCTALFLATGSVFSIFYFYVIPLYFLHQQFALTTYLAHIHESSQEYPLEKWTPYVSRLKCTFNCYLPKWLSFLLFNIDVHVPHHVSTAIPCYYLRPVQNELMRSPFASDIIEDKLTLGRYLTLVKLRKGCGILLT